MDEGNGWVKIHRKIFENGLSEDKPYTKLLAWIFMIAMANHKESFFYIRGNKFTVGRGQLAWSESRLAAQFGWSRGRIRRFLNDLKNERQIVQQKNNITSLITISNYDRYQSGGTTDGTTDGTHTRMIKNDKNNTIVHEDFRKHWNQYPSLPHVRLLSKARKDKLNARSKEPVFVEHWEDIIRKLAASPFHTGDNKDGWRATIDWILKNDTNYLKILERPDQFDGLTRESTHEEMDALFGAIENG